MIDLFLIILGGALVIAGVFGALLPVLPGPPLSYTGLILLQFTSPHPFGTGFLVLWATIVVVLAILDNLIPAWSTKKVGGSTYGVWGSIIGLIVGFFFPPFGILIGPIAGAFLGEWLTGKSTRHALKSAWGSILGTLLGTVLNVIASGMMAYYFFINI